MEKLKTAIVGAGKVAHTHAEALQSLTESEFTAVCSRTFEKAKVFADQYGVKAYQDVEEMIDKSKINVILVCTPHPVHAEPTIKAMKAGAHVLTEKPLASSLEDCDAMISIAKETNRKLGMISQRRFFAPVQRIKQAIVDGRLGIPIIGMVNVFGWRDKDYYKSDPWRGSWKGEGGGILVNQAPHQLDLLQWYLGPMDRLFGWWENFNHPYIEVEDTSVAMIRFKNGAVGNIVVSNSQNPAIYGKVTVFGKNGAAVGVQTDSGAMFVPGISSIAEPSVNDLWTIPGEEDLLEKWRQEDTEFFTRIDANKYYHQLQIQDFLRAILEDREPQISGEEGRKTVEIFTAIYRSQRDNAVIKFPLFPEKDRYDYDGRLKNDN